MWEYAETEIMRKLLEKAKDLTSLSHPKTINRSSLLKNMVKE
jgi:hypothetical protein